ncbi:MAG: hypothetical protein H7061_07295 [Bdellovibrionaceae bacterium]|nr:hypothetical protein [Bdellovibrio sp.]
MIQRSFIILLAITITSCSSTKDFDQHLDAQRCEQALEALPEKKNEFKLVSKVQEVSGTLLSYSATGAAYTVQVLWDTTVTFGAIVVLCAPTIAVLAAGKSSSNLLCFPGVNLDKGLEIVQAPKMGQNVLRNTENWNCPNVDSISRSIRKVAKCYANQGGEENQVRALKSLQSVEKSGSFYRCLSSKEREAFLKDLHAMHVPSDTGPF